MLLASALRRLLLFWLFCFVRYGVEGILNRFVGLSPFGERFSLLVFSVQHMLSFSIKS